MRNAFLFALLLSTPLFAQTDPGVKKPHEYTMEFKPTQQDTLRQLQLAFEISESDIKDYGLQQAALFTEISTRLSLGQIHIKDEPDLPKLVLRVKSIEADRAVASFVQLAFFEDAILKRNNSLISALTWSKATLISGPKEDLVKEVTQAVITMVNSFILDYHKAMSADKPVG